MSRPSLPGVFRATRTRGISAGAAVAAAVAVALTLAATGTGASAVQSAPDSPCPAPYPESQVAKGQPVTGLTVSGETSATVPEQFTGRVIGVLKDGIAPGIDMILAKLASPQIDSVGGIWDGMSGSPVYASDGRLVGAVSYGLGYGPSPITGITPAADMEALLSGGSTSPAAEPATHTAIPPWMARRMVASDSATPGEVSGGMTQLRLPLSVSGLSSAKRLRQAGRLLHLSNVRVVRGAAAGPDTATTPIVPGGNLAATLSYGDVTMGGLGTATAVCGTQVLGFGHPLTFAGPTTLALSGAEALYVQPSIFGSYKVANLTGPQGTIDQDRLAGVHGILGTLPATAPITSYVEAEGRSRTGTTWIAVQRWAPDIAATHMLADQDRVLQAVGPGSGRVTWEIRGVRRGGTPFQVTRSDMYADPYDITGMVAFALYDVLSRLQNNGTENVTFTSIHTSEHLSVGYQHYQLGTVQVRRAGRWLTVHQHRPLTLRAGATTALRVRLNSPDRTARWLALALPVPRAAGQAGSLDVFGGNTLSGEGGGPAPSLEALLRQLRRAPHHNDVVAHLSLSGGNGHRVTGSVRSAADRVVDGSSSFQVRVVR